jgi:hypothetical protein
VICPECGAEMRVFRGVLKSLIYGGAEGTPGDHCICRGCGAAYDKDAQGLHQVHGPWPENSSSALPARTEQRAA